MTSDDIKTPVKAGLLDRLRSRIAQKPEAEDDNTSTAERPGNNLNLPIVLLGIGVLVVFGGSLISSLLTTREVQDLPNPPENEAVPDNSGFFTGEDLFNQPPTPQVPAQNTQEPIFSGIETPVGTILEINPGASEQAINALAGPITGNTSTMPLPIQTPEPTRTAPQAPPPDILERPQPIAPPLTLPGMQTEQPPQEEPPRTTRLDPSTTLMPGTIIPAILITEINSDFSGTWVGRTTHPVYDTRIRNKLLPAGATLTGMVSRYSGANEIIRDTVMLATDSISLMDGTLIPMNIPVSSASGAGAIPGETNSHFLARSLGTAAFALVSIIPALTQDNGEPQSARDEATGEFYQGLGQQIQPLAQRYASLVPTTILTPGTPLRILVAAPVSLEDGA